MVINSLTVQISLLGFNQRKEEILSILSSARSAKEQVSVSLRNALQQIAPNRQIDQFKSSLNLNIKEPGKLMNSLSVLHCPSWLINRNKLLKWLFSVLVSISSKMNSSILKF